MKRIMITVLLSALLSTTAGASTFQCGDISDDGKVDIADMVYLTNYMFHEGPAIPTPPNADCDGNSEIDIGDLVCWVSYIFNNCLPPTCGFEFPLHQEALAECAGTPDSAKGGKGTLRLEVSGNDVNVYHDDAYYQCCLGYLVEYTMLGQEIHGVERDTAAECDCYCPFDLHSAINDLAHGQYHLTLYGVEGGIVGDGWFTINSDLPPPGVAETVIGECVQPSKDWPWEGEPEIYYTYSGDTLYFDHPNMFFNCGLDFDFEVQIGSTVIYIYERNLNTDAPVPCMCYFPFEAAIVGVAPGTYTIRVYNQDYGFPEEYLLDAQTVTLE